MTASPSRTGSHITQNFIHHYLKIAEGIDAPIAFIDIGKIQTKVCTPSFLFG
jgi:hypothetical protein